MALGVMVIGYYDKHAYTLKHLNLLVQVDPSNVNLQELLGVELPPALYPSRL